MVEAGADAVIGTHPHCLQGVEFIEGAPVFYSLGNFWFNDKPLYTGMAELVLHIPASEEEEITLGSVRFLPCTQYDLFTALLEDPAEKAKVLEHLAALSGGSVQVDDDGRICPVGLAGV
jgi:poly-gamma-glutamate synthesis protein (capsule biosynthesis protein)